MTLTCDPTPISRDDHPVILATAEAALADLNLRRMSNNLAPLTKDEFYQMDGSVYWQASDRAVRYRHANIEYLWTERGYFSWYRLDRSLPYPACLLSGETPIHQFRV